MTRRILFCDDDPDIREIIALSLGLDATLEVRACASAGEVPAAAAAWEPDLVLLDVMMPDMDGPTTLGILLDDPRTRTIPVLFMTARTQAYEFERLVALGAAGVIAKPFDPMTLASVVSSYF
jgi:two-component system, OmpR family, response regulator